VLCAQSGHSLLALPVHNSPSKPVCLYSILGAIRLYCAFLTGIRSKNVPVSMHYGLGPVGYCARPSTQTRMLVFNGGE
jgi:hypothetical protein